MRIKNILLTVACLGITFYSWSTPLFAKRILYWVTYSTDQASFIFQIDAVGNVVQTPRRLPIPAGIKKVALSQNGNDNFNLWYGNKEIVRTVIRKKDLKVLKTVQTHLTTTNPELLKITDKEKNNFMVVNESLEARIYGEFVEKAYPIDPVGKLNGIPIEVSARFHKGSADFICDVCGGSISSDGRTTFWYDQLDTLEEPVRMYISDLDDNGNITKTQIVPFSNVIGNSTYGVVWVAAAVSNVFPDGRRFIVFQDAINFHQQLLQQIESDFTINSPKNLVGTRSSGAVTIDPDAHFIIYARNSVEKSGPFLAFQGLDATGHSSGTVRVLVKQTKAIGLDILKDFGI